MDWRSSSTKSSAGSFAPPVASRRRCRASGASGPDERRNNNCIKLLSRVVRPRVLFQARPGLLFESVEGASGLSGEASLVAEPAGEEEEEEEEKKEERDLDSQIRIQI